MEKQIWTIDDHLRDQPADAVTLYRQVEKFLTALEDVTVSVSKTTVTFKGPRRGFAGARPTSAGLAGYFDIMRPLGLEDRRVLRISPYQRNLYVHHYRLTDCSELDEDFLGWLREAHQVGAGAHLRR